jgi:hypothetical protein
MRVYALIAAASDAVAAGADAEAGESRLLWVRWLSTRGEVNFLSDTGCLILMMIDVTVYSLATSTS